MKICIWGNVGEALKGNTEGGGELQMALIAKALAKAGNDVVIIDFSIPEDFITSDGIRVLKINGWNEGIRIIRTFTHRLPNLYRSLKNQNADVYYCRIRDSRQILAYWAARTIKAKFILGLASDLDALGFMKRLKYDYLVKVRDLWWFFNGILTEIVYPFLVRKSDLVIVQHEGQKKMIQNKCIKSELFANFINIDKIVVPANVTQKDFIFVGWLDKRKGFVELYELIKKSPNHAFKIIGPPRDKTGHFYYEKLKSFKNVSLLGKLSHSETLIHIANSKALISTSPMEGFPNVFIEAWACGIPVLSLYVDPGNVIEHEELGGIANGNIDSLIKMMGQIKNTHEFSTKAKTYVIRNHAFNATRIAELDKLFKEL
ncbi:MAG: glycosyltransferase [Lentimicrobiaceae bacterium]|jgi:glycosyltransferase involved in cell wall biosynthesis